MSWNNHKPTKHIVITGNYSWQRALSCILIHLKSFPVGPYSKTFIVFQHTLIFLFKSSYFITKFYSHGDPLYESKANFADEGKITVSPMHYPFHFLLLISRSIFIKT